MDRFGDPPPDVAALAGREPDHLVFWYLDQMLEQYADILGPLAARNRIVRHIRSQLRQAKQESKKKKLF